MKVANSNPVPDKILYETMSKTGIWIARKNWKEYLRTFARQYPNGMFIMNANNAKK